MVQRYYRGAEVLQRCRGCAEVQRCTCEDVNMRRCAVQRCRGSAEVVQQSCMGKRFRGADRGAEEVQRCRGAELLRCRCRCRV